MGVRGLSTFLFDDGQFFKRSRLGQEKVVIDGNNLRYALYASTKGLNPSLGGDYHKYYETVRQHFLTMRECGIQPIVIMDGAYEPSGIKRATVLKRMRDKARLAVQTNTGNQNRIRVLPLFALDVFLGALKDLDVEVIQTEFEADAFMASYAFEAGCAVITQDSDFFVFPVRMIPLGSIVWSAEQDADSEAKYMPCEEFNREKFLTHYQMDQSRCNLMASILGNDYLPPSTFQNFFARIPLPKSKRISPRMKIIRGFLQWIAKEKDVDEAIQKILVYSPQRRRSWQEAKIRASLAMYGGQDIQSRGDPTSLLSKDGQSLPVCVLQEYRQAKYSTSVLDIFCNEEFFVSTLVENIHEESSHLCAQEVLSLICSILLQTCAAETVVVFLRQKQGMKAQKLDLTKDPSFNLETLRGLDIPRKIAFFQRKLNLKTVPMKSGSTTGDCVLFQMALKIWSRNTPIYSTELHALCFWLMIQLSLNSSTQLNAWFSLNEHSSLNEEERDKLNKLFQRFARTNLEMKSKAHKFPLDFVYKTNRLQAVMKHLETLAQLVKWDSAKFCMNQIWHGTLLFNLHHDLEEYRDVDNRVQALLSFDPTLWQVYQYLHAILVPLVDLTSNAGNKNKGKRIPKNKRGTPMSGDTLDANNLFALLSLEKENDNLPV
ncbi:hypothetical protein TCAL_00812 [Tigriopus californicus]|uniref:Asteroid domain-containing protein n=1 Tax=Tigriopus californicus TaxID=6832 RepID=A0A553NBE4_TIGCA|nr:protein asteroid homolog 1-like [Tigriopus californicus]TRY62737.1 hypothetical protein TCAL_00812 [Tigriopus californicus]|eukprot:TCALIF_00812-PA protein Name:"Similar to ASTE1 Protein asteroid homolog 1 (Homo sapiens)" AED:0.21 eAED:0.22 QI:127/1/0.75/1/0.66/0.5/4/0/657